MMREMTGRCLRSRQNFEGGREERVGAKIYVRQQQRFDLRLNCLAGQARTFSDAHVELIDAQNHVVRRMVVLLSPGLRDTGKRGLLCLLLAAHARH